MVRPMARGSAANCFAKTSELMTTTAVLPGMASPGISVRPSAAFTPSVVKKLSEVRAPVTFSGSSPFATKAIIHPGDSAAMASKLRVRSRQ